MHSYTVQRGSAILVSQHGEPFVEYVTTKNQHFWQLAAQTEDSFTFEKNDWRLVVPKTAVTMWDHAGLN